MRLGTLSIFACLAVVASPAYGAGDPVKGKAAFARCAICHGVKTGEKRIGPSMAGVMGRKSGTLPGFAYSAALKKKAMVWNAKTLDGFLAAPMKTVPGTRMAFAGMPNPADRANVIAYLATLK
jgi:cytochrome c